MADKAKLTEYLFTYRFLGSDFGISIPAYSLEEAKARLKAMPTARYDGELIARIPAAPGAGWLVRAMTAIGNFMKGNHNG